MRDLLQSEEWYNSTARIPLALGQDDYGYPVLADLAEMPHLLIAGSTGSGKSACIHTIITSLLYCFSPDQLRFIMIDLRVVELQQYNALPHLIFPVITEPKKVNPALRWVINEMEMRYQIFAKVGVQNIVAFNSRPNNESLPSQGDFVIPEKLSYIVVIIEELADLMLSAPAEVEAALAEIGQAARLTGIHCVIATQRPSVNIVNGTMKAKFPTRIAFRMATKADSRTILDAAGAEKLLCNGEMLFLSPDSAEAIHAQGALIADQEIRNVVNFIAAQYKPEPQLLTYPEFSEQVGRLDDEWCDDEGLIEQCVEVIRSEKKASVSLLQRRLRLGYTRAARIMDELERRHVVGPSKGADPRDVLIDL